MTLTAERADSTDFVAARRAMIDSQLRTSGVNEPWVLAAMAGIAREQFVPAAARASAYIDRAIPLGDGRWLAAPVVHGKMLAEAAPQSADSALLVGDAKGYLAALLRPLVGTLEVLDPADAASKKAKGPFSLIVIDGAIEELPSSFVSRLADDGRLVTGLAERSVTRIARGRKTGDSIAFQALADVGIPVLPEFAAPKRWSF